MSVFALPAWAGIGSKVGGTAPTVAPGTPPAAPRRTPVVKRRPIVRKRRAPTVIAKPRRRPRKKRSERRFIEGELANVGATGITPWENRFGVVIGPQRLGFIYYALARPELNYTRQIGNRELSMSFAIPLRFEILDTRPDGGFDNAGKLRAQDWDEVSDFAQVLRYINFGGKEGHIYLDINQFKASSIGHGTVVKRYNPNLDLNRRRVSVGFDAFGDYAGFETYINDITSPNVMGALVFFKPLSLIDRKNYFLRSFSLGLTFAADTKAPMRNRLDGDDIDNDGRRDSELRIDQDTFQPQSITTEVISYGSSVEMKLVDTDSVDWKTYFDLSFLETGIPTDDPANPLWTNIPTRAMRSKGLSWGHLFRLNFDRQGPRDEPLHAVRIRLELRRFERNYLPSYFDTLYEVQRVQYLSAQSSRQKVDLANRTKLQVVLGREDDKMDVNGFYFETSWKIGSHFALAFALEGNDKTPDNNFFVHLEVPRLGNWQFLATYHRRTANTLGDLFVGGFGNSDIFIMKGRYRFADTIHFNAEAMTPFGIGPDSLFRNAVTFNLNAEFGFSYGRK
ncbi:MAG: hypothetical protein KC502_16010 [Myxococcales bacterium]|nr:hypothetical protein [Myxococcales bacterium]